MADVLRFTLRQQITLFVNRYTLQGRYIDGAKGSMIAHAQQKRFAVRKQVTFYADTAQTRPVFGFEARNGPTTRRCVRRHRRRRSHDR